MASTSWWRAVRWKPRRCRRTSLARPAVAAVAAAVVADSVLAPFDSLYRHGFARVAVAVPHLRVADPQFNAAHTIALAEQADERQAVVAVFPELGLSSYTSDDLFHQDALLDGVELGLRQLLDASRAWNVAVLVGAPLRSESRLFNCALLVHQGVVLGVVPKSYLPNYREFYEKRYFAAARDALLGEISVAGQIAPFGTDLLFEAPAIDGFLMHVEICEDLWSPIPPSTFGALAGATVLANLSSSNAVVGKADYRRQLCEGQSARTLAAYLYAAAGPGESTTDMAFDGHALIYENGERLVESERFSDQEQLLTADIDLSRLRADRMRTTSFTDTVGDHRAQVKPFRRVTLPVEMPAGAVPLRR
ncbi:MAG: synthase, partial [Acidimicrobiia bacterium]|nr:synthase [Acidimicrobiia bacterium]